MSSKLIYGDCLNKMTSILDGSVDMILTDIPYGEVNRTSQGLRNLDKKMADVITFTIPDFIDRCVKLVRGSIYIFCGTEQVSTIRRCLVDNKFSTRLCIWEKTNPSPMNGQYIWLSGIECCVFGRLPKSTFNEHCKNTVWRYPNGRNKSHPTEKPLKLFEYLISVSSNEDDLVLDPCMGSATTGVACLNLNRNFIGIEKDQEYFEVAKKRICSVISEKRR